MKLIVWFENFLKYRFLLNELVIREIKLKYKRSVLGILWSVLSPLLMMLILDVVFSRLFRFQIPNFLVYYLTGSLIFGFMQEATSGAIFSVFGNAGLINKVYIPKYVFPIAKTVSAFVNFGFSLIALVFVTLITGIMPSFALVTAPILFITLFAFVLGLSLIVGTYAVFFRDLIHFHGIFMLMWMYLTPIFYPENIIPDTIKWIVAGNPIYAYIKFFRTIVIDMRFPSMRQIAICTVWGIVSLALGLYVFKRNQNRFALYF
ncbi:MAG: ABC transporter permease [Rectinemataceae bacterium]|nr:ABC transporter permease [Rectinemataceae bacterium]